MPAYTSATCYPFQASPWSHEPQKLGWEQNPLDCPYEALQNRTVTHADTNFTVATSPQSIHNTTMQPNYTSDFNSDQYDYNAMVPGWPTPVHSYKL
jgi:hypothetical protein